VRLTDFKVLTFDCYGTLIDWETGITNTLRSLLRNDRVERSHDEILRALGDTRPPRKPCNAATARRRAL
jgi:2-haloacid dehalogenase